MTRPTLKLGTPNNDQFGTAYVTQFQTLKATDICRDGDEYLENGSWHPCVAEDFDEPVSLGGYEKVRRPLTETKSWLWPDHVIGKRESRRLREEHNALVNLYKDSQDGQRELLRALKTEQGMRERYYGK